MNKTELEAVVDFFGDKGNSQRDALTNSASLIGRDPRTQLKAKVNYEFGKDNQGNALTTGEAVDDLIGLIRLKKGADIEWHNIETLVDDDADEMEGEIGLLNEDGTFEKKATMSAASPVGAATVPAAHEKELEAATWVVFKLKGTVPASGKATFYIPYIALA